MAVTAISQGGSGSRHDMVVQLLAGFVDGGIEVYSASFVLVIQGEN